MTKPKQLRVYMTAEVIEALDGVIETHDRLTGGIPPMSHSQALIAVMRRWAKQQKVAKALAPDVERAA